MKMSIFRKFLHVCVMSGLAYAGLSLSPETASASWFNCDILAVWDDEDADQLFVNCGNSIGGASWFAIRLSDYNGYQENRFISMATAALLSGRHFRMNTTSTDCPGSIWNGVECRLVNKWSVYTLQ